MNMLKYIYIYIYMDMLHVNVIINIYGNLGFGEDIKRFV